MEGLFIGRRGFPRMEIRIPVSTEPPCPGINLSPVPSLFDLITFFGKNTIFGRDKLDDPMIVGNTIGADQIFITARLLFSPVLFSLLSRVRYVSIATHRMTATCNCCYRSNYQVSIRFDKSDACQAETRFLDFRLRFVFPFLPSFSQLSLSSFNFSKYFVKYRRGED